MQGNFFAFFRAPISSSWQGAAVAPKPFDYLGKARELRAKLGREKNVARTPPPAPPTFSNPDDNGYSEAIGVVRRVLEYKAAKKCELITELPARGA